MLKPTILFVTLLMAICSCKKTSNTAPTHPATDTSYLRKTQITYTFDPSGKKLADSDVTKWTYDAKGRPTFVLYNSANGSNIDTSVTTYGSNQTTFDNTEYANSQFLAHSHNVVYYNSKGLADSDVSSGTTVIINNGVSTTSDFSGTAVTVYFFDANGNDTLDQFYNIVNNVRVLESFSTKHYVNNVLSAGQSFSSTGILTYSVQWAAGNITSDQEYLGNVTPLYTHNYTYSNVLSGGFYGYEGTKNLYATISNIDGIQPANDFTETYFYTFDAANRVSTATRKYSNGQGNEEEVYTYY